MEQKEYTRVVSAVIVRDGRVLAAMRRQGQTFGGKWHMPGGKEDKNLDASLMCTLRRELKEELGVEADFIDPALLAMVPVEYSFGKYLVHFFRTEFVGDINTALDANAAYTWQDHLDLQAAEPQWIPIDWHAANIALMEGAEARNHER